MIRGATIGMKEADSSITSVVNGLFNQLSRKRVKELGLGDEDEAKYVGRLSREVDGSGKESSIAVGSYPFISLETREPLNQCLDL